MYRHNHFAQGDNFYHQYMQQHAQMTQWFHQLQHTIDPTRGAHFGHAPPPLHSAHNCCNSRGRPACRRLRRCCAAQARPACCGARPCCASGRIEYEPCSVQMCQQCPRPQPSEQWHQQYARHIPQNVVPSRRGMARSSAGRGSDRIGQRHGCPTTDRGARQAQAQLAQLEKQEEGSSEEEEPVVSTDEEEDNSSSEDELVCDVDAFVAILDKSDDSDKFSEDSFELVDSVEDEKFKYEYVELDEYGIMQRRYGKRHQVNTLEDEELKKKQRQYLYGERADAICGLETLMAINFDHFSDTNQPVLWPVLPLAL